MVHASQDKHNSTITPINDINAIGTTGSPSTNNKINAMVTNNMETATNMAHIRP